MNMTPLAGATKGSYGMIYTAQYFKSSGIIDVIVKVMICTSAKEKN
jgi:hypothetical protein